MSFAKADPRNRLRTPLPKIGIRPVIDGRYGGVRESLEGPTMAMANSAADLIQKSLRHACGLPVECVIADSCISGVAECAAADAKFRRENALVSLTVTPCWCYGSETIDMDPIRPKAIWGFNGTERPGAVYLAAALAGHVQKGLPCFGIYGRDVQDLGDTSIPADVAESILRFARCAVAATTMRGTSYVAMGGTSMGIAGSIVDSDLFEKWLGMRVVSVDMSEFRGRIEKDVYDQDEFKAAWDWVKAHCAEGTDRNDPAKQRSRAQKNDDWATSIKMALIARDLMIGNEKLSGMGFPEQGRGHNGLIGGFQGQRQWTDHYPNGDFMEAMLCSSIDWNGIRQPFVFATENDSLNAVSMLFGHLLTGTAQLFSDVRTYWSPAAIKRVSGVDSPPLLHLINSGPSALDWTGQHSAHDGSPMVKPWWDVTSQDVQDCLSNTEFCASIVEYFPGGGWSTDFTTRGPMPATMCRINMADGLGPVLQIAEGEVVSVPEAVHAAIDARTNPTWPTTYFAPRLTGSAPFDDAYNVMLHWGANHGAIGYGHIGADLITLASMLRIPVCMHNVPGQLFRPSSWMRFGALDAQGADYRACAAFGPLYG